MTTVGKTALRDVRVFDGQALTEPRTVVTDGAVIGADATGAEVVDATGGVLLPGLIDAHIHPDGRTALTAEHSPCRCGVCLRDDRPRFRGTR